MKYTCKVCGRRTDWDSSVGRPCYIVCNACVENLADAFNEDPFKITCKILKKGLEIEFLEKGIDITV